MQIAERVFVGAPALEEELIAWTSTVRAMCKAAWRNCGFQDPDALFKDLTLFFYEKVPQRTKALPEHAWVLDDLRRSLHADLGRAFATGNLPNSLAAAKTVMKILASKEFQESHDGTRLLPEHGEEIRDQILALSELSAGLRSVDIETAFSNRGTFQQEDFFPLLAELSDMLDRNKDLLRILEMLGRMNDLESERRTKHVQQPSGELHDLHTGAELERVVPSEFALLAHPVGRLEFYRRYTERSLLQYEPLPRGEGRGPLCIALDRSPSMVGEKTAFARGVALYCIQRALAQRRDSCVVLFDTKSEVHEFPWRTTTPASIVKVLGAAFGGGTRYRAGLEGCERQIRKQRFQNADILLIGDSEEELDSKERRWYAKFHRWMKKRGTRLFTIQVGVQSMSLLEVLKRLSSEMLYSDAEGLPDLEQVGEAIDSMLREVNPTYGWGYGGE